METTIRIWIRRALLNLLLVALAGSLLRYKILYSLPSVDYKDLMHAHSHFAFSGWVSLCLSVCIAGMLKLHGKRFRQYQFSFWLLLFSAFGMLLSFPFGGYNIVSITFSTLSILASWHFAFIVWKDLSSAELPPAVVNWIKAALFFYVISAAGPFYLARLMATGSPDQQWYIGSVYFFLHFQYNGWFAFAITGLFMGMLYRKGISIKSIPVFRLQFLACMPAFLLSALWMKLPQWLYVIAVVAAVMQVVAMVLLVSAIWKQRTVVKGAFAKVPLVLCSLALIAFCIKTCMQGLSVFPGLSYLAFGFRPVVIGYLHLVLLGFVTLFLLGYIFQLDYLRLSNGRPVPGIICFVTGVILNELFLFVQAVASIAGTNIPLINYFLFVAALLMLAGLIVLNYSQLDNNLFKYGIPSNKQRGATASTS